jgi:hypothetical protein
MAVPTSAPVRYRDHSLAVRLSRDTDLNACGAGRQVRDQMIQPKAAMLRAVALAAGLSLACFPVRARPRPQAAIPRKASITRC